MQCRAKDPALRAAAARRGTGHKLPPLPTLKSQFVISSPFLRRQNGASSGCRAKDPALHKPQFLQVCGNCRVQLDRFGGLLAQRGSQAFHLLLERLGIFFGGFGAHVSARGEHVAVLANVVEHGGLAKPRRVSVFPRLQIAAPSVVSSGDLGHVLIGEFAVDAVDQRSHSSRIDK